MFKFQVGQLLRFTYNDKSRYVKVERVADSFIVTRDIATNEYKTFTIAKIQGKVVKVQWAYRTQN